MSLEHDLIQSSIAAGLLLFGSLSPALAVDPDGSAIYKNQCASCRDNPAATHAPPISVMRLMSLDSIVNSLESGSMKNQGSTLTSDERNSVAEYLTPSDSVKAHFALAANPRASSGFLGKGTLGRALDLKEGSGVTLGGVIQLDANWLMSGGLKPGAFSGNFVLGVNLEIDASKVMHVAGGQFSVEFCDFQGMDTNAQAGSVQQHNNWGGATPYSRLELLQLWWRQSLFRNKFILKTGKFNGAAEFNTVLASVPVADPKLSNWTIGDLLYAPSGMNPILSGPASRIL